jgi:RND family efflux transporter MFP subunit
MRPLVIVALLYLLGCERAEPPVVDQTVRPAKLFRISARQNTTVHEFVGRLDAAQTLDCSFEVDGALQQLPVREGQAVAQGSLVAALDPTDFQLAVREAEVQLRLATQDWRRKDALLRERGISQSLVDDARAQFELSQVRLSQAQERLGKSRIIAPFDAFVARRYVDNRTKVRIGDKVVRLSDLNEMKVVASLPEELVATVTPERVVSLSAAFDFLPQERFPLTYRENTGEANPVAQTYEVTFTMARPADRNLLPGMTAKVRVELKGTQSEVAITIPSAALLSEPDGAFFVWLFDPASSRVSRRSVTVAELGEQGIGVSGGLSDGDLIVAAGASQLQEGMRIRTFGEPGTAP